MLEELEKESNEAAVTIKMSKIKIILSVSGRRKIIESENETIDLVESTIYLGEAVSFQN